MSSNIKYLHQKMIIYYITLITYIIHIYCNVNRNKNSGVDRSMYVNGYVGIGYDILVGNPLGDATTQSDFGYRNTVISQPVIKIDDLGRVELQNYNKSFWIRKINYCWQNTEPGNIVSNENFIKELYNDLELDNAISNDLIKSSTSSNQQRDVKNKDSRHTVRKSYCTLYESGMILPYTGKLAPHFLFSISKLPNELDDVIECPFDVYVSNTNDSKCKNINIWMKFFKTYGTHIAVHVITGGKVIDIEHWSNVGKEYTEEVSIKHSNLNSQYKYKRNVKGDKSFKQLWVIGGYFIKGLENRNSTIFSRWSKTIIQRPMPIRVRLVMLSQFFPEKRDVYLKALNYYSTVVGLKSNALSYNTTDLLFKETDAIESNNGTVYCPKDKHVMAGFVIDKVANKLDISDCKRERDACMSMSHKVQSSIWILCGDGYLKNIVTVASKEPIVKCPLDYGVALGFALGVDYEKYDIKSCNMGENSCENSKLNNRISWILCLPQQQINWTLEIRGVIYPAVLELARKAPAGQTCTIPCDILIQKIETLFARFDKGESGVVECPENMSILKGLTLIIERTNLDNVLNIIILNCPRGAVNCSNSCKHDICKGSMTILLCR